MPQGLAGLLMRTPVWFRRAVRSLVHPQPCAWTGVSAARVSRSGLLGPATVGPDVCVWQKLLATSSVCLGDPAPKPCPLRECSHFWILQMRNRTAVTL